MRLTIVCDDNAVIIDGVLKRFPVNLPPSIHAVQWYGTWGEVEERDPDTRMITANRRIESLEEFEHIISEFNSDS